MKIAFLTDVTTLLYKLNTNLQSKEKRYSNIKLLNIILEKKIFFNIINFQYDDLNSTYKRIDSSCFKILLSVDIDDTESNLQMEVKEF